MQYKLLLVNFVLSNDLKEKITEFLNSIRRLGIKSSFDLLTIDNWYNLEDVGNLPNEPAFYAIRVINYRNYGLDSDIVYFGETKNLWRRIRILKKAIVSGSGMHSGGRNLWRKVSLELSKFELLWLKANNKYIAKLLERHLITLFHDEHGHLPIGNRV